MRQRQRLVSGLLSLLILVGYVQPSQPEEQSKPSVSIEIKLLQDVVIAPSEMLLEITMQNISDQNVPIGNGTMPWWTLFGFDVRDAKGNAVPETPAGQRLRQVPSAIPEGLQLKPRGTLKAVMILNRVFDLRRHGVYSVQAHMVNHPTGVMVRSNSITVSAPQKNAGDRFAVPAFSIAISAPFTRVDNDWRIPVPIWISIKNLSAQQLKLAVWDGRTQAGLANEFGWGIDIRSRGKPARLTKQGLAILDRAEIPDGAFKFVPVSAGEISEQIGGIGGLVNMSQPGKYTVRVVLYDPTSSRKVESNPVTITVFDPAKPKMKRAAL